MPNQGLYCNQTGCCSISLQKDISGFQATIVRADDMAARSGSMRPGIMALMSSQYYEGNTTDLFSSWTNTSNIPGGFLEVAIIDQPSCERAQMNNATYACSTNSYCTNASYEGYTCYCATTDNNRAYLSEGCPPQQEGSLCLLFCKTRTYLTSFLLFLLYESIVEQLIITTPSLKNTAGGRVET